MEHHYVSLLSSRPIPRLGGGWHPKSSWLLFCWVNLEVQETLTELSESGDEYSDAAVEKPQVTNSALRIGLQMVYRLVITLKLTISWRVAWNLSTRWRCQGTIQGCI